MIDLNQQLACNTEHVAAKVVDGEAILINITTGAYYSMDDAGGLIWELITRGHSLSQIAEALTERYDVTLAQAQADVQRIAGDLVNADLATVSEVLAATLPLDAAHQDQKLPYDAPQLTGYDDMSDLLALDPPMPSVQPAAWEETKT